MNRNEVQPRLSMAFHRRLMRAPSFILHISRLKLRALTARGTNWLILRSPKARLAKPGFSREADASSDVKTRSLAGASGAQIPEKASPLGTAQLNRDLRPLVSVVMPYYNAPFFLWEAVDSLEAQSFGEVEFILINDGSNDEQALEAIEPLRDRIRWRVVDQQNCGLAGARNSGALAAHGDFLMFLDPDDLLRPTAIEKLYWLWMSDPNIDFVYSGIRHFGEFDSISLPQFSSWRLRYENYLVSTALIPRKLYCEVGGMREELHEACEDYDFWLELIDRGCKGRLLPETVFHYRRHSAGRDFYALEKQRQIETAAIRKMHSALNAWFPSRVGGREPLKQTAAVDSPGEVSNPGSVRPALSLPLFAYSPQREDTQPRAVVLTSGATTATRALSRIQANGWGLTLILEEQAGDLEDEQFTGLAAEVFSLPNLGYTPDAAFPFLKSLIMTRGADTVLGVNSRLLDIHESDIGRLASTIAVERLTETSFRANILKGPPNLVRKDARHESNTRNMVRKMEGQDKNRK